MELRHLRYFVAIVEEGSLTLAAKHRLHTAQPSLSRQIRDLEREVGADLLVRSAQGVTPTPAGRVFLDHARLALAQVDAAVESAQRAAGHGRHSFAVGFLSGHELDWLPDVMRTLREAQPTIEVTVVSNHSPALADALQRGKLDVVFIRPEPGAPDVAYRRLRSEPLVVVMPRDHRLAAKKTVSARELAGETFIGMSETAPVLRSVIADYLDKAGVTLRPAHEVDYLSMALSLIASTRGVSLLPSYALSFLPPTITSRPLRGDAPTIDLVLGHHTANTSPLLRMFLANVETMIERVTAKRA